MNYNPIVSRDEWLVARKAHLAREKELTRYNDGPKGRDAPPKGSDSCRSSGEGHP